MVRRRTKRKPSFRARRKKVSFRRRRFAPKPTSQVTLLRCANVASAGTAGFIVDGVYALHRNDFFVIEPGSSANVAYFGAGTYNFQLADLPAVTEFTNLFDQFRVNWISLNFLSMSTSVSSAGAASALTGQPATFLHYVRDSDDVTFPTQSDLGIDAMRQVPSYRCRRMLSGRPISIRFRPSYLSEIYKSALTTSYNPRGPMWLSTNGATTVPGFGLKMLFETMGTGAVTAQTFKCWIKASVSFRQPK